MHRIRDASGFDRFETRLRVDAPRMRYRFIVRDGAEERESVLFAAELRPEGPEMPAWAMGAVWYQIFTERFRNGNRRNDPHGPAIFAMPWTADWYATQPGEAEAWRARAGLDAGAPLPAKQGGDLFHWVWDRRYGGDLQGIVARLDHLERLGVTALYLNPVFEAESMHKYDATDFRHIDDNFGRPASAGQPPAQWSPIPGETTDPATWTWTPADRYFVETFLPACKARGIRVVIDGVFNHVGREFWAFRDVRERGTDSPYADWFMAEYDEEGRLASWAAWDGPSGWLPRFAQTSNGDLVEPVKAHLFAITRRWMDPDRDGDPSDGIDGWRLDVPMEVGDPFWIDWRAHVKSINPEAYIVAEIWQDAGSQLGTLYDAQMHYPFAHAVTDWLGVRPGMTAGDLARELELAFDEPMQIQLIQQNLLGSHDTDRFVSMLHNPGREYDGGNRPQDNGPNYDGTRPPDELFERSLLGVAIQATYLGAPMVYYGDELGMWGADDPTNRKPVPWPDLGNRNRDDLADRGMARDYARWFQLRSDDEIGPVLRYGSVRHLDAGDGDVFAFERELHGDRVVVVVNRGAETFDAAKLLPRQRTRTSVPAGGAGYWHLRGR